MNLDDIDFSQVLNLPKIEKKSRLYKPNGERECERRRKQIANGQLNVSNGVKT